MTVGTGHRDLDFPWHRDRRLLVSPPKDTGKAGQSELPKIGTGNFFLVATIHSKCSYLKRSSQAEEKKPLA